MANKKKPSKQKGSSSNQLVTIVQTGDVKEINITSNMTAKQALRKAEISEEDLKSEGLQIRLNNKTIADLDIVVKNGDQILIVGDIAGA